MQFSFSFLFHFILSFVGFLFLGIYLFRGSWRTQLRHPLALGLAFIAASHIWGSLEFLALIGHVGLTLIFSVLFFMGWRNHKNSAGDVRQGHNVLSLLAGAALFALTVQIHSVLFGVPVFELVK